MSFLYLNAICIFVVFLLLFVFRDSIAKFVPKFVAYLIMFVLAITLTFHFHNGKAKYITEIPSEFIFIRGAVEPATLTTPGRVWMFIRTKDSNLEPIAVELPYTEQYALSVLAANQIADQIHDELYMKKKDPDVAPNPLKPDTRKSNPVSPSSSRGREYSIKGSDKIFTM